MWNAPLGFVDMHVSHAVLMVRGFDVLGAITLWNENGATNTPLSTTCSKGYILLYLRE
jgi:hypothetical protein